MSLQTNAPAATTVAKAVTAYASRLHAPFGEAHHIASPLGAWLLLAMIAPLASGEDRNQIEEALGCDADAARGAADALLQHPHPAVGVAIALWSREIGSALETWRASLHPSVATGGIPDATTADAWARSNTRGLIDRFPATFDDLTRLVLASAVATDVKWREPFGRVDSRIMGGPWSSRVRHVMHGRDKGELAVARTKSAGDVGVQIARSEHVYVVSVIAEAGVSAANVIAAAHEVAALASGTSSSAEFVSLFDLPLTGHAWRISEEEFESTRRNDRRQWARVFIPAWSATARIADLTKFPGTGFATAASTLMNKMPSGSGDLRARATQLACAEFDPSGFRAAAVTEIGYERSARRIRPRTHRGTRRVIELRISRPFASVAVAVLVRGPAAVWHGVPLFSGWVTEPNEPVSEPPREEFAKRWVLPDARPDTMEAANPHGPSPGPRKKGWLRRLFRGH